ncbi:hypothetical protein [Gelatiniphilus marinus]|uniref:Uncharacterized protein n=1 Tax=Gelatiniphilus marinus TaxID=1759464 RepID=A0ABW5JM25_9FLAO
MGHLKTKFQFLTRLLFLFIFVSCNMGNKNVSVSSSIDINAVEITTLFDSNNN